MIRLTISSFKLVVNTQLNSALVAAQEVLEVMASDEFFAETILAGSKGWLSSVLDNYAGIADICKIYDGSTLSEDFASLANVLEALGQLDVYAILSIPRIKINHFCKNDKIFIIDYLVDDCRMPLFFIKYGQNQFGSIALSARLSLHYRKGNDYNEKKNHKHYPYVRHYFVGVFSGLLLGSHTGRRNRYPYDRGHQSQH